ncbi:MAG: PrgI family protein [bacterium]|nr:PrgI family protein [bacterium]
MNYQVPQFIEIEDKIFGPLTLKQFIYLAGGAGISFLIYRFITISFIAFLLIILVMILAFALAFYKVNNKPLINMIEYAFNYFFHNKLYLWKKEDPAQNSAKNPMTKEDKEYAKLVVPKLSESRLKDLAWSLDINESIYSNKNQR